MANDRVPTINQVLAARNMVRAAELLGRESDPDVIRDAEWPLDKARPDRDRRAKTA